MSKDHLPRSIVLHTTWYIRLRGIILPIEYRQYIYMPPSPLFTVLYVLIICCSTVYPVHPHVQDALAEPPTFVC